MGSKAGKGGGTVTATKEGGSLSSNNASSSPAGSLAAKIHAIVEVCGVSKDDALELLQGNNMDEILAIERHLASAEEWSSVKAPKKKGASGEVSESTLGANGDTRAESGPRKKGGVPGGSAPSGAQRSANSERRGAGGSQQQQGRSTVSSAAPKGTQGDRRGGAPPGGQAGGNRNYYKGSESGRQGVVAPPNGSAIPTEEVKTTSDWGDVQDDSPMPSWADTVAPAAPAAVPAPVEPAIGSLPPLPSVAGVPKKVEPPRAEPTSKMNFAAVVARGAQKQQPPPPAAPPKVEALANLAVSTPSAAAVPRKADQVPIEPKKLPEAVSSPAEALKENSAAIANEPVNRQAPAVVAPAIAVAVPASTTTTQVAPAAATVAATTASAASGWDTRTSVADTASLNLQFGSFSLGRDKLDWGTETAKLVTAGDVASVSATTSAVPTAAAVPVAAPVQAPVAVPVAAPVQQPTQPAGPAPQKAPEAQAPTAQQQPAAQQQQPPAAAAVVPPQQQAVHTQSQPHHAPHHPQQQSLGGGKSSNVPYQQNQYQQQQSAYSRASPVMNPNVVPSSSMYNPMYGNPYGMMPIPGYAPGYTTAPSSNPPAYYDMKYAAPQGVVSGTDGNAADGRGNANMDKQAVPTDPLGAAAAAAYMMPPANYPAMAAQYASMYGYANPYGALAHNHPYAQYAPAAQPSYGSYGYTTANPVSGGGGAGGFNAGGQRGQAQGSGKAGGPGGGEDNSGVNKMVGGGAGGQAQGGGYGQGAAGGYSQEAMYYGYGMMPTGPSGVPGGNTGNSGNTNAKSNASNYGYPYNTHNTGGSWGWEQ